MLRILAHVRLSNGEEDNFILLENRNIKDSAFITNFSSSLESVEIMEVHVTIWLVLDLYIGEPISEKHKINKTGRGGVQNKEHEKVETVCQGFISKW